MFKEVSDVLQYRDELTLMAKMPTHAYTCLRNGACEN